MGHGVQGRKVRGQKTNKQNKQTNHVEKRERKVEKQNKNKKQKTQNTKNKNIFYHPQAFQAWTKASEDTKIIMFVWPCALEVSFDLIPYLPKKLGWEITKF